MSKHPKVIPLRNPSLPVDSASQIPISNQDEVPDLIIVDSEVSGYLQQSVQQPAANVDQDRDDNQQEDPLAGIFESQDSSAEDTKSELVLEDCADNCPGADDHLQWPDGDGLDDNFDSHEYEEVDLDFELSAHLHDTSMVEFHTGWLGGVVGLVHPALCNIWPLGSVSRLRFDPVRGVGVHLRIGALQYWLHPIV